MPERVAASETAVSSRPTEPTNPIRWGIIATGRIADEFAVDLAVTPGHTLAAVASRRPEAAAAFAATHGAARSHGSYADLVADPEIDAVYVATPHHRHADDVMACLEAGRPVLCEKPLTLDRASAEHLVHEARHRRVLLAEAMWMRANPAIRHAVELARSGAIGQVASVRADLGFVAPPDKARLWDPALGASALLDVGIYPFTFAQLVLGEPERILAAGTWHDGDDGTGFDTNGGATLTYASGAVASLSWGQLGVSDSRASIAGSEGLIEIDRRFHHPDALTLTVGERTETIERPRRGKGFVHEILAFGDCLAAGRTESDVLPLDETVSIMRQLDDARAQLTP